MSRRFNKELLAENFVGFLLGALVLGGGIASAFWMTKEKPIQLTVESALSLPETIQKTTLKASSVDSADIERLYQKKRDEIAAKKAAQDKQIADEKARIEAEKKRWKMLEQRKQQEVQAERQRIAVEKEKLAEEKRQAAIREKQEQQRIAQERKRIAQEKVDAQMATKKAIEAKERAELATKEAAEKKRQADEARKKAEIEKKAAEEAHKRAVAEKKAKAAVAQKKAEEKAKALAAQKAKQIAEQKEKAEVARKAKIAAEEKAKVAATKKAKMAEDKRIADELAASIASIEAEEANTKAKNNAIVRFGRAITGKIRRSWDIPPKLPSGLRVTLKITTTTSGRVKDIRMVRSSGNRAFDNSAKEAVRRAEPLPMPKRQDWAKEFKEITIRFPE